MSGTSLDGLDIAICEFEENNNWNYKILFAETQKYTDEILQQLKRADQMDALNFMQLDRDLGKLFGELVNNFIQRNLIQKDSIDAIASHGQTIFHQPKNGFTTQIGSGAHIAAVTGIRTISDFRSLDVALGGQGAPLVPIGDELLFSDYDYCLNFGGIANVSYREKGERISFDIGIANMASNFLVRKLGKNYDNNGDLGRSGNFDKDLFDQLNNLDYFKQLPPKSLGKEYFDQVFKFTLTNNPLRIQDQLHTFGRHLAFQVAKWLKNGTCLSTGGGSYNTFWLDEIKKLTDVKIAASDPLIIDFKEAMIFAFLGLLRLREETNTLKSVTGAKRDSIGGCIYLG